MTGLPTGCRRCAFGVGSQERRYSFDAKKERMRAGEDMPVHDGHGLAKDVLQVVSVVEWSAEESGWVKRGERCARDRREGSRVETGGANIDMYMDITTSAKPR